MEGPLLVLKSWMLTALAIWIYQRWFQRVAPSSTEFERFCAGKPVVGALFGSVGFEKQGGAALALRLGRARTGVATLGGFPWPHYCLTFAIIERPGAVLLQVVGAQVLRSRQRDLPALATLLRDTLNELPEDVEAWLHTGAFNNGLVAPPAGGWSVLRGHDPRPKLSSLEATPERVRSMPNAEDETRLGDAFLAASGATAERRS
jgi:hypothetical protein